MLDIRFAGTNCAASKAMRRRRCAHREPTNSRLWEWGIIGTALCFTCLSRAAQAAPQDHGFIANALPDLKEQTAPLLKAVISLPVAAVLGAVLAFRPRRRGTPARTPMVIHTQILLALVGAIVMLVVGSSLARAFGIVGAASLVRYRAK